MILTLKVLFWSGEEKRLGYYFESYAGFSLGIFYSLSSAFSFEFSSSFSFDFSFSFSFLTSTNSYLISSAILHISSNTLIMNCTVSTLIIFINLAFFLYSRSL